MLFRIVAKPLARDCASEAEGVSYARIPERIIDVDSQRVDFFATIVDPRNWRGNKQEKQQAVLLWLLRQWNNLPQSKGKVLYSIGTISMNQIRNGTGMDPRTIDSALTELGEKGIIGLSKTHPTPKETRYTIALLLPVADWKLAHIHLWQEPRTRYCPF